MNKIVTHFITPVEDPTIPADKVVCRDCGRQVPASLAEMVHHQQKEGETPTYNSFTTVADIPKST